MNEEFRRSAAQLDDAAAYARPDPGDLPLDETKVWEALGTVIDPEIGLDIVTLGLVYEVECIENAVRVTFSLTTPGCPLQAVITGGIENAVGSVPGVEQVLPVLVWEPRWHPGMIQEEEW